MENIDLVFKCDYGNRTPAKELIKTYLQRYDANELPMVAIFVNNNPYSLELFTVMNFTTNDTLLRNETIKKFNSIGCTLRTDLTFQNLREFRINSATFIDEEDCELRFNSLFWFVEKNEFENKSYPINKIQSENLLFLSYSRHNELDVDKFVPILHRNSIPIWYDKHCIDYGDSTVEEIQLGITKSVGVIFWITKEFLLSNWCKTEMESFLMRYASNRNVLIITIKSEDILHGDLPIFLQNLKYLDRAKFKTFNDISTEVIPAILKHIDNMKQ